MARQRFIWPDIWSDPDFGRLQPVEQVLFIGLFSNADDEGRILADPAFLRSAVFPYKDMTNKRVRTIRDALARHMDNIRLYTVDRVDYIALTNWSQYQKPKYPRPSKLPEPPPDSGNLPEGLGEASPASSGSVPPKQIPGLGWEGKDRDGMGASYEDTASSETTPREPRSDFDPDDDIDFTTPNGQVNEFPIPNPNRGTR